MGDDVTISRGKDVAQGPRLKIDLTTGMYRFELEQEPAVAPAAPATSASPPLTAPAPALGQPGGTRMCRPAGSACWSTPRRRRTGPRARSKGSFPGRLPPRRARLGSRAPAPARRCGATDACGCSLQGEEAQTPRRRADGGRPTGTRRRQAQTSTGRASRMAGQAGSPSSTSRRPTAAAWWSRASAWRRAAARPSGCWAPTVPARPPCSTWSRAWCRPMPARSRSTAAT